MTARYHDLAEYCKRVARVLNKPELTERERRELEYVLLDLETEVCRKAFVGASKVYRGKN